jgi:hypothetical protein
LKKQIINANTTRHAFGFINPQYIESGFPESGYPEMIKFVGKKIIENAIKFSDDKLNIRVIIFDFDGKVALDSNEE